MNAIALLQHFGVIYFSQESPDDPVIMKFELQYMEPYSVHAIHIHEYGDLTNGCASLGGHFNPTNETHSLHAGDLFHNFQVNPYGQFLYTYSTRKISLFHDEKCVLGRSVVIHKFPDDYGMEGMCINNEFVKYTDMSDNYLTLISQRLGYSTTSSRNEMLNKLISESKTTGNASTRIDCAIIGRMK